MKNFSSITENLDITTKKYVDDNKVTSVDGLSGGTLTSPLKVSGGDQSTASKISLNQSANGQITDSSTSTLFGFMSSTTLTVGGNGYALALRGSGTRPTYKGVDLALYSDIGTVPTDYVKYTAQTLTDAQKSQARSNIGAGTSNFSGNYNDLSHLPTIPAAANNGMLTIQKNGTTVETFTANQSTNTTANITVPTQVSELTNDSGYITSNGSVKSVIDYNDASKNIKIGYQGAGISGDSIRYIAGYTTGDSESVARIKDIPKDKLKSWLEYATVATSGSYNDLGDKPMIPTFSLSGTTLTITL